MTPHWNREWNGVETFIWSKVWCSIDMERVCVCARWQKPQMNVSRVTQRTWVFASYLSQSNSGVSLPGGLFHSVFPSKILREFLISCMRVTCIYISYNHVTYCVISSSPSTGSSAFCFQSPSVWIFTAVKTSNLAPSTVNDRCSHRYRLTVV